MNSRNQRLELTWANKDRRLLSHGESTYEWVEHKDYRVAEVRLLEVADTIGTDPGDNLLIHGDAMHALTSLINLPDWRAKYLGKVKLCYIDPPFNTGKAFKDYDDAVEHSVWLTLLRDRLQQIKQLLSPDGSVWVHLDDYEQHRARTILDEVFGADCFQATIVWQKADSTRNDAKGFSKHQDYILVYSKSPSWERKRLPRNSAASSRFKSPDSDPTPWFDDNPTAPGARTHQGMVYAIQHPITGQLIYPAAGRCWWTEQPKILAAMSEYADYELRDIGDEAERARVCGVSDAEVRSGVPAVMLKNDLDASATTARARYEEGNWPAIVLRSGGNGGLGRKAYESAEGLVPTTWWTNDEVGHNREAKAESKALFPDAAAFDTPKPERLIERILTIGSDEDDLILDCFAGSATTAAVAHKMGRRWITVELNDSNLDTYIRPRLAQVIDGTDRGGISEVTTEIFDGDLPEDVSPDEVKAAIKALAPLLAHGTFSTPPSIPRRDAGGPMATIWHLLTENPDTHAQLIDHMTKQMRAAAKARKETTSNWDGGGGYTYVRVAPSMFDTHEGYIVLSDWAVDRELQQAVCAQLRFTYQPHGPFAGTQGKTRVAVINSLLTASLVDYYFEYLADDEVMVIVAQALEPGVQDYIKDKRKGCRARKIPRDLARLSASTTTITLPGDPS